MLAASAGVNIESFSTPFEPNSESTSGLGRARLFRQPFVPRAVTEFAVAIFRNDGAACGGRGTCVTIVIAPAGPEGNP